MIRLNRHHPHGHSSGHYQGRGQGYGGRQPLGSDDPSRSPSPGRSGQTEVRDFNDLNRQYGGFQGHAGHTHAAGQSGAQISQSHPHLLPAVSPQHQAGQIVEASPGPPAKSGFSLANLAKMANLTEIKGLVDRMGGLDGILTTVTKVQKVVGVVSQMAPMMKVLMGSFGKKSISQADAFQAPARPRQRRRRTTGASARPGGSGKRRKQTRRRKR